MGELILWKQITAELNGHTVTGLYSTSREGLVTVRTPYESSCIATSILLSKDLKVVTNVLFYGLLSRVARELFSGERVVVHPHNSCISDIPVTTKGRLCLMQSSVISRRPCSSQSRAARK